MWNSRRLEFSHVNSFSVTRFRDTPTIFFCSLRQATYQTLPFVYWIMDFLLKARIVHRIFTFLHRVIAKIEGTFSTTIIIE